MTRKVSQTGLKWPLNGLKLARNRVIFWQKCSHFYAKPSGSKELGYCPPPDISKVKSSKELRRIMTTSRCQSNRNRLSRNDLWRRSHRGEKNNVQGQNDTKYNQQLERESQRDPVGCGKQAVRVRSGHIGKGVPLVAKPRNRAADFAVYLAIRAVVCVIQMVPPPVAFWLADQIAWLLYRFVPSRRRVALDNLACAFPELAGQPDRAHATVQAMYRHFVRAVVEALILGRKLHLTNWRAFLDLYPAVGLPAVILNRDRAALLVTGHFGNWELFGHVTGAMGFHSYAIARVLDNPYLERYTRRLRQSTGQTLIAKKDDFDRLTQVMQAKAKVGTLADQDAGPRGVFVDFFGRPASTHKAVALMAIEFDAVMVVFGVPRVDRRLHPAAPPMAGLETLYYAVEVEDIIDPRDYAGDPNAVKAITQRYTAALESLIRRHPEQYFWLHRRWKHQPAARKPTAEPKAA